MSTTTLISIFFVAGASLFFFASLLKGLRVYRSASFTQFKTEDHHEGYIIRPKLTYPARFSKIVKGERAQQQGLFSILSSIVGLLTIFTFCIAFWQKTTSFGEMMLGVGFFFFILYFVVDIIRFYKVRIP